MRGDIPSPPLIIPANHVPSFDRLRTTLSLRSSGFTQESNVLCNIMAIGCKLKQKILYIISTFKFIFIVPSLQINEILDIFLRHKNWEGGAKSNLASTGHRFFVLENDKIEILFVAMYGQQKINLKALINNT